jgi:hypothetical protein
VELVVVVVRRGLIVRRRIIRELVVTTSGKAKDSASLVEEARLCALRIGVEFVPRVKGTPMLTGAKCALVFRGDGIELLDASGGARWSPGMAALRIRRWGEQPDHVALAGEVRAGDQVLDCTLGRGHDALVLEHAGATVVGIEASLPLFGWTVAGLRRHGSRVECWLGDALSWLRSLASGSFDVVFFDPMFSKRAHYESGFALVRRHGERAPVSAEMLREARRVARRWVVVKAAPQAMDLRRLGLDVVPFKRNAELRFGRSRGLGE